MRMPIGPFTKMTRLILFLLALGALGAPPLQSAVTVTSLAINSTEGSVTYSTITIVLASSGPFTDWRVRVSTSSCSAGTGGFLEPSFNGGGTFTPGFTIVVGGLTKNNHYYLCPELSDAGSGGPYSTGAEIQADTLAVEENAPRPIAKFNSDYPNTGDFATMPTCPSVNAQGYCKTPVTFGTTDIRTILDAALTDQCNHGTVLAFAHSATPVTFTANTYSDIYASCNVLYWDAGKITGNVIDFGVAHGLSEGDLLTIGQHANYGYPSSSSCYGTATFLNGVKFYAHVTSTTAISLVCADGTNTPVVIGAHGGSPSNGLFIMPHVQVSGQCPSEKGSEPCVYWKPRSMYEVILRSDTPDILLPPPGTRLTPSYCAAGLCSIWTNRLANVNISSSSAFFFTFGNNDGNVGPMMSNVRLGPGIELQNPVDPGQGTFANLVVSAGFGSSNTVDRVYLHGAETRPPSLGRWGGPSLAAAEWEGSYTTIRDSYIDNLRQWHTVGIIDGSSMIISEGPGPTQWLNNWIEGAGIPVHFDGGQLPVRLFGDIQLLRNHFYSPPFMMYGNALSDGHPSGHRQQLEFKAGHRSEVIGNTFDTNWMENNPNGEFIVATSVSPNPPLQGIGVTDLNITSNIFKHGAGGVGGPIIVYGGHPATNSPARYTLSNNLFYDIDGSKWESPATFPAGTGKGWLQQWPGGGEGALQDHNTIVGNVGAQPQIASMQNTPFAGWTFTNNFTYGYDVATGGISQTGGINFSNCFNQSGEAVIVACFTPSFTFKRNVMMSNLATSTQIAAKYPTLIADNYNPASMSLATTPGWINYDATGNGGSYGLKPTSNYRSGAAKTLTTGPATDHTDVGINEPRVLRSTGHVFINDQPVQPIGSTSATVNFVAPTTQSCPVRLAATAWTPTPPTSGVTEYTDTGTKVGPRNVSVTGLTPSTTYHGIVLCQAEQPEFTFTTSATAVTFTDFISGYTLDHDWEFGSDVSRNVNDITDLAVDWVPYGIAGTTPINQSWERYQVPPFPGTFNTTNYVFTPTSLELTATIPGGGGLFNGGINSGQINTKTTWNPVTSGKTYAFEGRMKTPRNSVGMWPAFWLYTKTPGQDDHSEIDFFEIFTMTGENSHNLNMFIHGPNVGSTVYSIPGFGPPCGSCWTPGFDFSYDYHLYQEIWTPTQEYHFIDGQLIVQRNFLYSAVGAAQLIVTLAVGSDDTVGLPGLQPTSLAQFPMKFAIDHIKQWSSP